MSSPASTTYRLIRGETWLGNIVHHAEQDSFPWYGGVFEAAPAFAEVRALFEEELRLLDAGLMAEHAALWGHIEKPGMRLEPCGGGDAITDFLIHIKGPDAWWRC